MPELSAFLDIHFLTPDKNYIYYLKNKEGINFTKVPRGFSSQLAKFKYPRSLINQNF